MGLSTTAIFDDCDGYFFGNVRVKASISIMAIKQSLVGMPLIAK